MGRVDPVSNLVDGGNSTLWPVLLTLDLFAVLGIFMVMSRWRREMDET